MKQISLLAATTPSSPAELPPAGLEVEAGAEVPDAVLGVGSATLMSCSAEKEKASRREPAALIAHCKGESLGGSTKVAARDAHCCQIAETTTETLPDRAAFYASREYRGRPMSNPVSK